MERMRAISIITGLAKLAAAISLFLFVHGPNDTLLATTLQSLGFLGAGIIGFVIAIRSFVHSIYIPRRKDLIDTLKEGGHVFLATASITLYTTSNTVMVGLIAGNTQAGLFSLSERLIRAVTGLVTPFLQAAYPHVVRLSRQSQDLAIRFVRRTLKLGVTAGLVVGACFMVFAQPLTSLAFGRATVGAVEILRIISVFPSLIVVTASMGILIFMPFGLEKAFGRLLLLVGLVNVALGCALIPFMGAIGAALGMTIMEALQAVGGWYILRRHGIEVFFAPPRTADTESVA
jgi:polysaccharide transporter, PST family